MDKTKRMREERRLGAGENGDEEGRGRGFQEGDVLVSLPCMK